MKTFKRLMALAFLVVLTPLLNAQQLQIGVVDCDFKTAFDKNSGNLYFFQSDSLKTISLNTFEQLSAFHINVPEFTIRETQKKGKFAIDYLPLIVKNNLYLVHNEGGEVFLFNSKEFIRIDSSYSHKMQLSSTVFEFNDKIFRYGGYGFWSCRNIFTYFDEAQNDWNLISPDNQSQAPNGTLNTIVKVLDDKIFIFGGVTLSKNSLNNLVNNENGWVFNDGKKRWFSLGKMDDRINLKNRIDYYNDIFFINKDNAQLLCLKNNSYKEFKSNLTNFEVSQVSYFYKGDFYLIGQPSDNSEVAGIYIKKIPEIELIGEQIDSGTIFIKNRLYPIAIKVVTLLIILISTIYFIYKRRKKIVNNKITLCCQKLIYQNKEVELKNVHYDIIKRLLHSDEVVTSELMTIIHKDHLHISQLSRILVSNIEEINFKLQILTGSKIEFIHIKKSNIDQRIKVYSIVKEWFEI